MNVSRSSSQVSSSTNHQPRRSKVITDDEDNARTINSNGAEKGCSSQDKYEFRILFDLSPEIINKVHSKPISCVKLSPNGTMLATSSADGTIAIWELITQNIQQSSTSSSDINVIHDDELLAPKPVPSLIESITGKPSSHQTNTKDGYRFKEPTMKHILSGHLMGVNDVSWSPDSLYLCSASDDKTIRIWSVETGEALKTLYGHNQFAYCVAFSPQGNIIASGSFDETVRLWDVRSGKCLRTLPAHSDPVSSIMFSRDGSLLITSSYDGFCRLWDSTTGQCLKTILLNSHDTPPLSCARIAPHCNYLLVSSMASNENPAIVRLWALKPFVKPVKTYTGHTNERFSTNVMFHPKRNVLVGCSEDGFVYLWDVQTTQVIGKLNCNTRNFSQSPFPLTASSSSESNAMDTSSDTVYPVLSLDLNKLDFMVTCTTEPRLVFWRETPVTNSEK